ENSPTGSLGFKVTGGTAPYSVQLRKENKSIKTLDVQKSGEEVKIAGLLPGDYTLSVTDAAKCGWTAETENNIKIPLLAPEKRLTFELGAKTADYCGLGSGTVEVAVKNGSANLLFQRQKGAGEPEETAYAAGKLTGLPAGTWKIVMTDRATGCSISKEGLEIKPDTPSIKAIVQDAHCGQEDGAAEVELSDNWSGAYAAEWHIKKTDAFGASSLEALDSKHVVKDNPLKIGLLGSGVYHITVKSEEKKGCKLTKEIMVSDVGAPVFTVVEGSRKKAYCGQPNGSLEIKITKGTGQYSFESLPNTEAETALQRNGNYLIRKLKSGADLLIQVKDGAGCKFGRKVELEEDKTVAASPFSVSTSPSYCGKATGTAAVKISETDFDIVSYQMGKTSQKNPVFRNILAREAPYQVTVTDSRGCTSSGKFAMKDDPKQMPKIELAAMDSSACSLGIGRLKFSASGGKPGEGGYSYQWHKDGVEMKGWNTSEKNELFAGSYQVKLTDNMGCVVFSKMTQLKDKKPMIVRYEGSPASCPEVADGALSISLANREISGSWFRWGKNADFEKGASVKKKLPNGSLAVTVRDVYECEQTVHPVVGLKPGISLKASFRHITCAGGQDGWIKLENIANAQTPYVIVWEKKNEENEYLAISENGTELTGLAAGTYRYTLTDGAGCPVSEEIRFDELSSPVVLELVENESRPASYFGGADGRLSVKAKGGYGGYVYEWSTEPKQTAAKATGLSAGSYSLAVADKKGCKASGTYTVGQPGALALEVLRKSSPSCYGKADGTARVRISGGKAPYIVSFRKEKSDNWSPLIRQHNIPDAFEYVLEGLAVGRYEVRAEDQSGRPEAFVQTVSLNKQPEPLEIASYSQEDPLCFGSEDGSAEVAAKGGTAPYTYYWKGLVESSPKASGLKSGTYELTVWDANKCSVERTFELTDPSPLAVNIDEVVHPSCQGKSDGSVQLTADGGTGIYNYQWNDGTELETDKRSGLSAGIYEVAVKDANQCLKRVGGIVLKNPGSLVLRGLNAVDPLCFESADGRVSAKLSGGTAPYHAVWDDKKDKLARNDLKQGDYSVKFSDAQGCSFDYSFRLNQPEALRLDKVGYELASCHKGKNGKLTVTAGGGIAPYGYTWTEGQTEGRELSGIGAGNYVVTVSDRNKCRKELSAALPERDDFAPPAIDPAITICKGQRLPVDAGEWSSYLWTSDRGLSKTVRRLVVTDPGNYILRVTNERGCEKTVNFSVEEREGVLKAGIVLPTTVSLGDTAVLVNISKPAPDAVFWTIGEQAEELKESTENKKFLLFDALGTYEVSLKAQLGECADVTTRKIRIVLGESDKEDKQARKQEEHGLFRRAELFPVPVIGMLNCLIELKEPGELEAKLYGLHLPEPLKSWKSTEVSAEHQISLNLKGLTSGVYLLQFASGGESYTRKILIK
ncbi:MAG: hypothetical protein MI784_09295, partial [Cytophagales bacterium]|nr:hypothetical protein [Cytophagales bacterium]